MNSLAGAGHPTASCPRENQHLPEQPPSTPWQHQQLIAAPGSQPWEWSPIEPVSAPGSWWDSENTDFHPSSSSGKCCIGAVSQFPHVVNGGQRCSPPHMDLHGSEVIQMSSEKNQTNPPFPLLLTHRHMQKCSWLHLSEEIRDRSYP